MGLRFIIGRSGTGKSTCIMEEIAKAQEHDGQRLILIVPEQFTLESEKQIIQSTGGKGILRAQVLSFGRLAFRIFDETGGKEKALLSEIGKSMVLRKIILDHKEELEYFKNSVDKAGFMEQLSLTITELFRYSIAPEQLQQLYGGAPESSVLKMKLRDMAIILRGYHEFLDKDYISSDDTLDILFQKLNYSAFLQGAQIWIDGFHGFTPQEYKIISRMMQQAVCVTITLTMDRYSFEAYHLPMTAPFFESAQTAQKLKGIALEEGVAIETPLILDKVWRFQREALRELEQYFFSYPSFLSRQAEGMRFMHAENKYMEVEYVAQSILRLVQTQPIRFREIAVLTGDLEGYGELIASLFTEYGIPFFIDRKEHIMAHPLIVLIRSVLQMVGKNLSYESVFAFLKTGLTTLEIEEIDLLENYVLAFGIKGYKWKKEEWNYGSKRENYKELLVRLNTFKNKFMQEVSMFFQAVNNKQHYQVQEITCHIFALLKQMEVAQKLEKMGIEAMESGNVQGAAQHGQIWKATVALFEDMVSMIGKEVVTIDQYAKILEAGFAQARLGAIPPTVDTVIVGDIERTRMPKIQSAFIVGVNEGILPAPIEDSGIFTEIEREEIEKTGTKLSADAKRRSFEEQFLIYCGLTKAEQYLCISWCTGDLKGQMLRASSMVTKLQRMYPRVPIEDMARSTWGPFVSPKAVFHQIGLQMREAAQGYLAQPKWRDAFELLSRNGEWKNRLIFIHSAVEEKKKESKLEQRLLKRLYKGTLFSSVSRLEKFEHCPYAYFAQYTLGAKERTLYEIDTPDLGNLFHGVLESFSNALKEEGLDWTTLSSEQVRSITDRAVEENVPKIGNEVLLSSAANQYLIRRLKRISNRAVWALTHHVKQGIFQPVGFELEFGKDGTLPPIIIAMDNGERMVLRGKIDRVDILDAKDKAYVKIIDYKSGRKTFQLQDIYYGLQLQLILYLDAFMQCAEGSANKEILPGGVFYFRIKDPMIKSAMEMSVQELEELLRKELKLSGLVLRDEAVLKGMDTSLEDGFESKTSAIIPVAFDKAGEIKAVGTSVATKAQYQDLISYVYQKAGQIGNEILKGCIETAPYRNGDAMPCDYCPYASLCGFQALDNPNMVRELKKMSSDEIWHKIKEDIK